MLRNLWLILLWAAAGEPNQWALGGRHLSETSCRLLSPVARWVLSFFCLIGGLFRSPFSLRPLQGRGGGGSLSIQVG